MNGTTAGSVAFALLVCDGPLISRESPGPAGRIEPRLDKSGGRLLPASRGANCPSRSAASFRDKCPVCVRRTGQASRKQLSEPPHRHCQPGQESASRQERAFLSRAANSGSPAAQCSFEPGLIAVEPPFMPSTRPQFASCAAPSQQRVCRGLNSTTRRNSGSKEASKCGFRGEMCG
jgi:hypothetical protein